MKITIAAIAIVLFIWMYCLLGANKQRKNKTAGQRQTHYDRIRSKSVDEMAEYIFLHDDELNDKICKSAYEECPYGDNVDSQNCIGCVKKWLESEVKIIAK